MEKNVLAHISVENNEGVSHANKISTMIIAIKKEFLMYLIITEQQ